jgi:hypothetical protein
MREEKRERRIGHLPCSNEGVRDERCSEKALRRLSRSIEEVRLHSQHGQICACVYVLLIRSHSFFILYFFFSHTQTKTKETSCLRFENNHFLSRSLSFDLFLLFYSDRFDWLKPNSIFIGC